MSERGRATAGCVRAEYAALVPAATFGYLICEATTQHRAMWAALAVTAVAACAGHTPALRRRVGEGPLLVIGAGYLAGALAGLVNLDRADQAIVHHGQTSGWGTLALAVAAGFLLAGAVLDRRLRGYAMWVPAALTGWLATLVLPGQYPLVIWALVSSAAAVIVVGRPAVLEAGRAAAAARAGRGRRRDHRVGRARRLRDAAHAVHDQPRAGAQPGRRAGVGGRARARDGRRLGAGAWTTAVADRRRPVASAAAVAMCAMALWTLAAAILGAFQLTAGTPPGPSTTRSNRVT